MDIEFHYYMTYLIAARAGLGPEVARIVAYAAQQVDDNDRIVEVDGGRPTAYRTYISQTLNILRPKASLFRIYPLFHFIPGDPSSEAARRKDGKMHALNTTPDSENARLIFGAALESEDWHRVGVACHAYADTWAHQNFVGYSDAFNALGGPLSRLVPNIGHADAQERPDWPGLVWRDSRLAQAAERRDNRLIFLDAAEALFARLAKHADRRAQRAALARRAQALRADLAWAIGGRDPANARRAERIGRYRELSARKEYGGSELPPYARGAWFEAAVRERVRGLRDRGEHALARWDPLSDIYTWADPARCRESDWFRFQEAVKAHQASAWAVLAPRNFKGLELPKL